MASKIGFIFYVHIGKGCDNRFAKPNHFRSVLGFKVMYITQTSQLIL